MPRNSCKYDNCDRANSIFFTCHDATDIDTEGMKFLKNNYRKGN